MALVIAPQHATLVHRQAGGVRDDRLLHTHLRAVGEAGDHPRILAPPLGETFLGGRVAVRVLQALDVSADQWRHADAADKPDQIHLHTGLITVTAGEHDARGVGTPAELGTDGGVDLGVHQHEVLAVLEAVEREVTAELDRTGHVDDDIDPVGLGDGLEILRDGNRSA